MAKVIDITDKLAFNDNPKLKIKDVEVEVNASASNVLKVMDLFTKEDVDEAKAGIEAYEMIFSAEDRKKLDHLNLSINDFMALIKAATDVLMGEEEPAGE